MRKLRDEELEKSLELVGVAAERGSHRRRVDVGRRLDRSDVELQGVAESLHATEHPHGVALGEAAVEELDVVPDTRRDPAARVDELEREIRRAVARAQPLLARHGVHALDGAVLLELRDRGHGDSNAITERMPSCACISSKARLTCSSCMRCEMKGSTSSSPRR